MKISAGLVYNKHTGRIVGFTDLGEINNELKDFEVSVNEESTVRPTATHVLTLMVRGIDFRLNYPIAYFAGAGVKAYELYHIVWEAIRILEFLDFKVWFVTCDGASANKKFFLMHANANNIKDGVVFWTQNKYAPDRRIYFICDVPHLLKTTRNNFANSHAHQNTRELFLEGKEVSWQHIISLFELDIGLNRIAPGFRQTKLTVEHVRLTPRSRMKVSLAAQVLSNSVDIALQMQNNDATISTQKFIGMFNKLFDILNVKSTTIGFRELNDDKKPFKGKDNDNRLEWLLDTFLPFLANWENEVNNLELDDEKKKKRMYLSQQTSSRLKITSKLYLFSI
ncbi:uncharacterized protein [Clytia hemisphaerica]|uniref:uncharacterized protein n=1 Tax=Clytia hemisphaerica TaxID=252671 RepID=UPI0034D51BA3